MKPKLTQCLMVAIDIRSLAKQEAGFQNGVLNRPLPIETGSFLDGQAVL